MPLCGHSYRSSRFDRYAVENVLITYQVIRQQNQKMPGESHKLERPLCGTPVPGWPHKDTPQPYEQDTCTSDTRDGRYAFSLLLTPSTSCTLAHAIRLASARTRISSSSF